MASPRLNSTPADSQELSAAAARVLESATFSRSPRLREFLSFVVKCSLEGRVHEVNEYSLGVQVFGKNPNYNPNEDNIVRVSARQLRAKLSEYYSGEGSLDPRRVDIPKGAYLPVLTSNSPAEAISEHPLNRDQRWLLPLLVILAVLAISGWGATAFVWLRTPVVQPQEPYLLGPLLTDKSRPTTIVLDDPMLPQAWPMIGKLMTLDDFVAGRYLDPKYYETEVGRFIGTMLKDNYIVHLSSLQSLLHISEIARSNGVNPIPAHSRTMQPQKLENGNFVFLGGVGSNPWVGEIQKHLAFEHQVDPNQGLRTFVNRSPRAGEPALFKSLINDAHTHYYTRVAVVKNPFGAGKVALLGGTSRQATEAAYQFALSQTGLDQVQRLCGVPLSKLSDFELILETKSLAGAPVTRTIVASRCGIN